MIKTCFIISSIGKDGSEVRKSADDKYDLVFKPILEELGYKVTRADKIGSPGSISREIVENIINSNLVIADVSDEIPNVFYELAIRNAVKKPVIVFKAVDQTMPFDIYDKRAIPIDMTKPRVWETAKTLLKEHVTEAEKKPEQSSESILSDFSFKIEERTKPLSDTEKITYQLKDMQDEMRRFFSESSQSRSYTNWQKAFRDLGEYIVIIPQGSSSPGCEVKGDCYMPNNLVIEEDQTVTWINNDTAAHMVTSGNPTDGPDGKFDSGLFGHRKSFSHAFHKKGDYPYFCVVHPWQRGIIVVE